MLREVMERVKEHEHEHEHHHHDEDDDDEECCCHHHHHDDDDEDEECHHHHHHHDDDDEDEECHHHHHHHDDDDDDEECCCHHHDHEHEHDHDHDHDHEEDGVHVHNHHHHHHHHHGDEHDADEIFTSWGLETPHAFDRAKLEEILKKMSETEEFGTIIRCKGMLPTGEAGKWMYFDMVPEQYEIREGAPEYTGKVVVIGADLKEDALKEAFVG